MLPRSMCTDVCILTSDKHTPVPTWVAPSLSPVSQDHIQSLLLCILSFFDCVFYVYVVLYDWFVFLVVSSFFSCISLNSTYYIGKHVVSAYYFSGAYPMEQKSNSGSVLSVVLMLYRRKVRTVKYPVFIMAGLVTRKCWTRAQVSVLLPGNRDSSQCSGKTQFLV